MAREIRSSGLMKGEAEQEADLFTRRKNDPAKLEIAARLRRETTLPLKATAARVQLGTSKTANAKLHQHLRTPPTSDPSQAPLGSEPMKMDEPERTKPWVTHFGRVSISPLLMEKRADGCG